MAEVKKNNHGTSCLQESTLKVTQRKGVELKSGNHDELGTIFFKLSQIFNDARPEWFSGST